jgi:hypothetical protein
MFDPKDASGRREARNIKDHKPEAPESIRDCSLSLVAEKFVDEEISPYVINSSILKQLRDEARTHSKEEHIPHAVTIVIENLEREANRRMRDFLDGSNDLILKQRIESYLQNSRQLIAGRMSPQEYREFIEKQIPAELSEHKSIRDSLQKTPRTVILLNHHNRTPEINGGHESDNLIGSLGPHDMTPVLSQIFTARAFREFADVEIARFGKPFFRNDSFYTYAQKSFGFQRISDAGVQAFAYQISQSFEDGVIPTVCPEAGMRLLGRFRSGGIVAAALAGAEQVMLVAESPWVSLLVPRKHFSLAGIVPISEEMRDVVQKRQEGRDNGQEANRVIGSMLRSCRKLLAHRIVELDALPMCYRQEVKRFGL